MLKIKISPRTLLKGFSKKIDLSLISTPQVSDALFDLTGKNYALHNIKPLNNLKVFGKVVTVKTKDYDWGTSVKAIDIANENEVIFIVTEGNSNAVWGELTSKAAKIKNIAGTIICGACRDLHAIKNIRYPVFAEKVVPNAGSPLCKGKINVEVKYNGIKIKPNDYVIGDECGVVVIPNELFDKVIEKTREINEKEKEIKKKMSEGFSLSEILEL
ncbi:Dimethylmenaquinone methyltransferase [Methanothermus fervidus DSM 2088]|uniref:Dimethylmenaquinone methyltransferase n=1 Tax=Methanothermus fervidus (strain ATCC 43054 / DSM 2088 / JCM 10308 / V24 S) TaxID=523846 RepID=E3GY83_METFV|nr:RraA family protein [Methanothermus fervidus]ADP77265.1 Dimethylmenaquinone methyltransferase [Methanothermus fervidus DSM 2088]